MSTLGIVVKLTFGRLEYHLSACNEIAEEWQVMGGIDPHDADGIPGLSHGVQYWIETLYAELDFARSLKDLIRPLRRLALACDHLAERMDDPEWVAVLRENLDTDAEFQPDGIWHDKVAHFLEDPDVRGAMRAFAEEFRMFAHGFQAAETSGMTVYGLPDFRANIEPLPRRDR